MIDVKHLGFAYQSNSKIPFKKIREEVLEEANWALTPGHICGLLGSNGAGKTTLLKILAGLLFPQSGQVSVHGLEPKGRLPEFLQEIYYLPEEFYTPDISVDSYVKRYGCFYPNFDHLVFNEILDEFQIEPSKSLKTFSHGQKKKAMLAFGLATNAKLVLLDEPSNGLDIPSKSQFRNILLKTFDENRTYIISTHQVHDLEGLIDRVSIIENGRILLNESLEEISAKLSFEKAPLAPEQVLYSEQGIEGANFIRRNSDGIETQVDLSLLFGLATTQTELLHSLFSEGGK